MKINNQKKGIIYGIIGVFLSGLEPIVANSRPMILDAYFFAATSTIVEAIVFLPLMTIERKKLKFSKDMVSENNKIIDSKLNGWKKNKLLLIYIGLTFGIGQILFFLDINFRVL